MDQTIQGWLNVYPRTHEVLFHYTSVPVARLIGGKGLRASDIGMGGAGVYFSQHAPSKFNWPQAGWKKDCLENNYGEEEAKSQERQDKVDAVVIVIVHEILIKEVPERPGAK